jgi:hypothetical protein
MATWKEGQRVRVIRREVTAEDRAWNTYFEHMAGLSGTIQSVYSKDEIAVQVDPSDVPSICRDVHREANRRMRERFVANVSEEQRSKFTAEELNFEAHYMLLVRGSDLEKI